jgi:hypothetical protein
MSPFGLGVIRENINKTLRNRIAPMDFDIDKDGKIVVDDGKYDLGEETLKIKAFVFAMARLLNDTGISAIVTEINPNIKQQIKVF